MILFPLHLTDIFLVDDSYVSNTPFTSSSTFNGVTLAEFGFDSGLIGSWTMDNGEVINICVGSCSPLPPTPVPGPLPILGGAAAFGSVRKLRNLSSALKFG